MPTIENAGLTVNETHTSTGQIEGTFTLNYGADGAADDNALQFVIEGPEGVSPAGVNVVFEADSNTATVANTALGDLTVIRGDGGNYSFTFTQQAVSPQDKLTAGNYTIKVEAKDADGDMTASAELTATVKTGGTISVGGDGNDTLPGGETPSDYVIVSGDSGTGASQGGATQSIYNICFILDTSGSMDDRVSGSNTRLDVARDSIRSFIENSIGDGNFSGTVNLAVVTFASSYGSTIDVSITKNGSDTTYSFNGRDYTTYGDFENAFNSVLDNIRADGGTNYEAGFRHAATWFDGKPTAEAVENITYFLTDGEPTFHGTNTQGGGNYASLEDVQGAWNGYQTLLAAADQMSVHAVGFGTDLSSNAMKTLAMLDNTGADIGTGSGYPQDFHGDGNLYYGRNQGQYFIPLEEAGTVSDLGTTGTYYIQLNGSNYQEIQYNSAQGQWGYYSGLFGWRWNPVGAGTTVYQPVSAVGNSTQVVDAESLSATFSSGFTPPKLAGVGADTIDASHMYAPENFLFGDVMNTDALLKAHPELGLPEGSGYQVFQKLGWSDGQIADYIRNHHEWLARESLLTDNGDGTYTAYYRDANGHIWDADGRELTGEETESKTWIVREGGNDTITGSSLNDTIYGQEGNDTIHGGDGNDSIYGGSGNDTLYGDAGNDILVGGDGDDILIGGAGDDVLTGGVGSDTFKYMSGDLDGVVNGDTITDFTVGKIGENANADILDISELLSGLPEGYEGKNLMTGGYLQFENITGNEDGSTTVTIRIDTDGHGGDVAPVALATVTMYGLDLSGVNPTNQAQAILNQLVDNNEIKF